LPKIRQSDIHLCNGYGLITDYFCEIMHELRKESFYYSIQNRLHLTASGGDVSIRDQRAVQRLASGMMKILSPHDKGDRDALQISLELAVEYRQRIHDWLCTISPGEYRPKTLHYELR